MAPADDTLSTLERRLAADEARLAADETRLISDEARLEAEEAELHESRVVAWSAVALGVTLAIAILALVLAVIGLQDDVGSISRSARTDSVGTAALRDSAVTMEKIAPGAVSRDAIAGGAVGSEEIDRDAVVGAHIARDSITGADIREHSLATVPAAHTASSTKDADRLGGVPSRAYLSQVVDVRAASVTDTSRVKGPLAVRCPAGSRVIAGGATIEGAASGASLVTSAPDGGTGWTATARVARTDKPDWRLVVSAVCAVGGE